MKGKLFLLALLLSTASYAQETLDNAARFGTGADSVKCLQNISIYTEYVKTNNFAEAYTPWKEVFTQHPLAQVSTYTNGVKILKYFITKEKDPAKKAAYAKELMDVYDQQIKNLDQLNTLVKTPSTEGSVLGQKAFSYVTYVPGVNTKTAYDMLSKAVSMEKGLTEYYIIQQFMKTSLDYYKEDKNHGEQLIQDYLDASGYIVEVLDKYNDRLQFYTEKGDTVRAGQYEKAIDATRIAKDNIDGYFINSGAANCEDLQAIYAPKVEENKNDSTYLKKVISIMGMLKCTDQEAYLAASEYAHAIDPTPQSAMGCGYRYYKKGETNKALEYFDQAIQLEPSHINKADLYYKVGFVLYTLKQYSKARSYAQNAIGLNPRFGAPYILIANCYAASPKWDEDDVLNKCTYFLVIDKLQRAKAVDPTVGNEANKLIASYKTYTPQYQEIFMRGHKVGDPIRIGGWINESTTIQNYQ